MDNIKTVYFAHPKVHYNTEIEIECLDVIITMLNPAGSDITEGRIDITNPNQKWIGDLYQIKKDTGDPDPFQLFRDIAKAHDIVVGATFLDGTLGAGVAEECKEAYDNGKEVYLIMFHEGMKLFLPFTGFAGHVVLSIEETREKIKKGEL